jgi:hypothetical protein
MEGARNADVRTLEGVEPRLPWGSALLVIAALSVVSWAGVIGLVAGLRLLV